MNERLSLRQRIARPELTFAPAVFDAMSALLAQQAGFAATYVGGATLGYLRAATEAGLSPHDFVQVGTDIRSATDVAMVMDFGVGWGDPMHMRRNLRLAEAAGYDAIEIEDQVHPKRAHHHIGVERLIPMDDMVAKITELVRARRNPDLLIIARTNAVTKDMSDALRRCDAFARAGADMLFPICMHAEQLRTVGERTETPLTQMVFPGFSFGHMDLADDELIALGYRLIIDGVRPFTAMFAALEASYRQLRDPPVDKAVAYAAIDAANTLVGLPELIAIERRTTERD